VQALVLFVLTLSLAAGCARASTEPSADGPGGGPRPRDPAAPRARLRIEHPVARVMPNGVGGVYLEVDNDGDTPDRLERAASSNAADTQLHTVVSDGDIVSMHPAEGGFEVPAHGKLTLEHGGKHVMVFGVRGKDRPTMPLTLHFQRAGDITVDAAIVSALPAGAADEKPAARELRVCADPNNLPFSNERGEGFENRLASLIAEDLGARVTYTLSPQRRGFIRETLKAGRCDVVMGVPTKLDMLLTTKPYYRSGYVFVHAPGTARVASLDAPELRGMRIGVPLVGDDGANPPPVLALAERGLVANVRGYSVYGDYREESPPADLIRGLRRGEIDVAIAWGPLAGYYAAAAPALELTPLPEKDAPQGLTFSFDISMGVRKGDQALAAELDGALSRRRDAIVKILDEYRVPPR
jgi:mxaJ protein